MECMLEAKLINCGIVGEQSYSGNINETFCNCYFLVKSKDTDIW
jgi:hypothetical protein